MEQDSATCLMAQSIYFFNQTDNVNWPPRNCDLTPLVYFVWRTVKEKCYADKPETIQHLKVGLSKYRFFTTYKHLTIIDSFCHYRKCKCSTTNFFFAFTNWWFPQYYYEIKCEVKSLIGKLQTFLFKFAFFNLYLIYRYIFMNYQKFSIIALSIVCYLYLIYRYIFMNY